MKRNIIVTIVSAIIIIGLTAAAYTILLKPERIEVVTKNYVQMTAEERAGYQVDDNELDGNWILTEDLQFSDYQLKKYEDLRDYYQGRDNPFSALDERKSSIDNMTNTIPTFDKAKGGGEVDLGGGEPVPFPSAKPVG